ncbi:MAG: putative domain S-box/diguanylate cyclase protein [Actinomycetia bacterium]|nr:putative domain S-box/diguanylate cyclase protein [Actinomycetes bacterium]
MRQLHEVLIVEHDEGARSLLREALDGEPVVLTEATTGSAALAVLAGQDVDVALVALVLPDVAGLQLVSEMRDLVPNLHLIIVSKRTSEADRLQGFAAGADDYITKPFGPADVVARVRVGLRHHRTVGDNCLDIGELRIDLGARRVTIRGTEVPLPRLEFDLLAHLALRPDEVCSRQDLLETVWGSSSEYQVEATVTEHVRRLREKLGGSGGCGGLITTVRGAGYRFAARALEGPTHARLVATALAPSGVVELTWRPTSGTATHPPPTGIDPVVDRAGATRRLAAGVAEIGSWPVAPDDREYLQAALIGISTEVTDAVIILSSDLTVRSFNRAAEALYGWSEDEVRGRRLLDVIPWREPPDAFGHAVEDLGERGTWMGELDQRRRDGTSLRIRSTVTALLDPDGEGLGVIIVNRPAATSAAVPIGPDRVQVDDILGALARDEFVPYFQPIVRLEDEVIVGVEALARWERSDGTIVEPSAFLPEAERSGLIVPLGTMILEKACQEAARWRAAGSTAHLAANISARQLGDGSTPDLITRMLARHAIPPDALWLEVTESSLIEDLDRAALVLGTLADAGVSFSIDDFGTGWASLTYLRRFPVRGIKIDRSFVEGLGTTSSDEAIVRSILDLGRDLSLAVVAEGVETAAQCDALRALGCRLVQGYVYSKPAPAAVLHPMLASPLRPERTRRNEASGPWPRDARDGDGPPR